MNSINPTSLTSKAIFLLLQVWIVASGLYYIENLFSPSYYMGYDEGTLHKTIKYAVCSVFTVAFCLLSRAYLLLIGLAVLALWSVWVVFDRGSIEISMLSILITATMFAFILVPSIWESQIRRIGLIMVYVGAVVGVFSIVELTVLATLFESIWAYNNSIRSVSTLFNPNNLGLYAGACLLILPYLRLRVLPFSVCLALIFFSFIASGSRTAWVGLLAVVAWQFATSRHFRMTAWDALRRYLARILFCVAAIALVFMVYQLLGDSAPDIETVHRGVDLYTASIRWTNFLSFIDALDFWIILPDFAGVRAEFIQDNFYLVVLNSAGVLGVLLSGLLFATHFSIRDSANPDMVPWRLVFAFYMVSGLSGSHLNAFPNNQLFFLSMGAVFALNMRFLRYQTAPVPQLGLRD
jgi:hypothetical protein